MNNELKELAKQINQLQQERDLAYDDLADANDQIKELKAALQWISVEDRLPDVCGMYLTYRNGAVTMLFLNSKKRWCMANSFYEGITHWQPLPPEPKT